MERPAQLNLDLVAWVVELGQRQPHSGHALMQEFCDGLLARGIPLERVHVSFIPRHPQLRVGILQWLKGQRVTWGHVSWPERIGRSPVYRRNPLYLLRERRLEEVRSRLTDPNQVSRFRITQELADEGFTDYIAMAVESGFDRPNTVAMVTSVRDGFSDEHVRDLRTACWTLQGTVQAQMWRTLSETLCRTYIGTDAGPRVFAGEIRRGHLTRMDAVVWFCDMRDFTRLSEMVPENQLVSSLNTFFDVVGTAIEEHGGEILKFVGDAVLAVYAFDSVSGIEEASAAAFASAIRCFELIEEVNLRRGEGEEPLLRCGIGIHSGEVIYGNIGTETRLDFTVIGRPVNLASRVEGLCGRLNEPLLVTETVASHCPEPLIPKGAHRVKGINEPVNVFGFSDQALEQILEKRKKLAIRSPRPSKAPRS